jgi:choline dehydrogenase
VAVFDVVIVGGGTAGCVLARRLVETGDRTVLLLEAGPDLRAATPAAWRDAWRLPMPPDWEFDSEPDETGATSRLRRGRVLGGTSWLTRFAVRGAPSDFDRWVELGNPGWSFADVLPAFRRLESDAELGHEAWHGETGPIPITRYPGHEPSPIHRAALAALDAMGVPSVDDVNAPGAMGVGRLAMSSRDGVRVTTVDGYLGAGSLPRLDVRAGAIVARVTVERGRAVGVELADGTAVAAGWVILAAGTYGSPSILLRSGVGPAAELEPLGIAPIVDLPGVGANLADHPGVDLDSGWRGDAATGPVLHSIATWPSSESAPGGPPDLMVWLSDPLGDDPGFYLDPILLKPESRGTVRLRSADPLVPPRITLPGIRTERDRSRLIEGYRFGLALAARPEIRALAADDAPSEPATEDDWRRRMMENTYSLPHVVGTCAMGPYPGAGAVVDATGRVHGVDHLSVIDASIIPEPPSGFPHIVTIMVAEHLSQMTGAFGLTGGPARSATGAERAVEHRHRADLAEPEMLVHRPPELR